MAQRGLFFLDKFIEPIKEGVKTSTLRLHFDGKVGDKIVAQAVNIPLSPGKRYFAILCIQRVTFIRFDEINKDIAKTEGYLHEDLLKEELYNIYPDLEDSSLLYYILFEVKEVNNL